MQAIVAALVAGLCAASAYAAEVIVVEVAPKVTIATGETMHLVCNELDQVREVNEGLSKSDYKPFMHLTSPDLDGQSPCFSVLVSDIVAGTNADLTTVVTSVIAGYELGFTSTLVAYRTSDGRIMSGFMVRQVPVQVSDLD